MNKKLTIQFDEKIPSLEFRLETEKQTLYGEIAEDVQNYLMGSFTRNQVILGNLYSVKFSEIISLIEELIGELDYDQTNWKNILRDSFVKRFYEMFPKD